MIKIVIKLLILHIFEKSIKIHFLSQYTVPERKIGYSRRFRATDVAWFSIKMLAQPLTQKG